MSTIGTPGGGDAADSGLLASGYTITNETLVATVEKTIIITAKRFLIRARAHTELEIRSSAVGVPFYTVPRGHPIQDRNITGTITLYITAPINTVLEVWIGN